MRELAVVVSNNNENVTPLETIKAIKDAGFKDVFIQWYNRDWEYSQEQQLSYIKELGLNVIFAHLGQKNINAIWENGELGDILVRQYKKDIDTCYANDISMVILHLSSSYTPPKYNEIGLNRIKEIVDYAEKYDIKVAFENGRVKGYLEYVLSNIKNNNAGVCYDSGHCHVFFDDDFNFKLFKGRIFAVHLHDNDKSDDQHLLPFDGTIDWNLTIKKLKEAEYNGPITFEMFYKDQYLEMTLLDFYKKGYEVGKRLNKVFKDYDK
jgi:sugar phosphate isomerase/epimerase